MKEMKDIVNWIYDNWDSYVGVSFLLRGNAEEAGYDYLPQEVVTKEVYDEYVSKLQPVNLEDVQGIHEIEDDECEAGVCPAK